MAGAQALKRISRIKFPQRRQKASGSASQSQAASTASNVDLNIWSKVSTSVGGKASLQPKRTPISNEEIEAILLGGSV